MNKHKQNALVYITLLLGMVFAGGVLVLMLHVSWVKQEMAECEDWRLLSLQFENYWQLAWQKEQCDHYGIPIEAPVIKPEELKSRLND